MVTKTGFTSNHCVRVRKVPQTNTYMSSKVKFDAAALLLLACWHGIKTGPAAPAASWLSRWNSEAFASQVQFWLPSVQPDMILCCFFFTALTFSFFLFLYKKKKKKSSSLLDPVMMESCCCHTGCFAWANKKWWVKKRGHCGVEEKKIQHLPDVFLSPYSLKTAHRTFELQLHFRKINFDLYTQNNAVKYNMKHYLTQLQQHTPLYDAKHWYNCLARAGVCNRFQQRPPFVYRRNWNWN